MSVWETERCNRVAGVVERFAHYAFFTGLICTALSTAAAQETMLRSGARIRFRTNDSVQLAKDSLHVAQLARLTRDSLIVQRCMTCARLGYARAEVKHLEVFRPSDRGSRFLTGFGVGGLLGLGLGVLGATTCHGGDKCDGAIFLIPFGGIVGGLIGGMGGYLTAYRWDAIPRWVVNQP